MSRRFIITERQFELLLTVKPGIVKDKLYYNAPGTTHLESLLRSGETWLDIWKRKHNWQEGQELKCCLCNEAADRAAHAFKWNKERSEGLYLVPVCSQHNAPTNFDLFTVQEGVAEKPNMYTLEYTNFMEQMEIYSEYYEQTFHDTVKQQVIEIADEEA